MMDERAVKAVAKKVADSLMFAAPEIWAMHIQRLLDEIFQDDPQKPVIWREGR
jgi:hypothetical protein